MCQLVLRAVQDEVPGVLDDLRRVAAAPEWTPGSSQEIAHRLIHTSYMGSAHSSEETRRRAQDVAREVGAHHTSLDIDSVVGAVVALFSAATGKRPSFEASGGSRAEDVALQNIQARLRMVVGYMLAQLLPWVRHNRGAGLLVLGSSNVDEALRGYLTKYDCSSADLNPIGSISKVDLKRFLLWASDHLGYPSLKDIVAAPPTAELRPETEGEAQEDEKEMGMTYEELGVFGRLRKLGRLGPVSMFRRLLGVWGDLPPATVAEKVRRFFRFYSINRHKATVLTPSYHAEDYSPEDNRFDLRPFLYNASWPWQFRKIDEMVERMEASEMAQQDRDGARESKADVEGEGKYPAR